MLASTFRGSALGANISDDDVATSADVRSWEAMMIGDLTNLRQNEDTTSLQGFPMTGFEIAHSLVFEERRAR